MSDTNVFENWKSITYSSTSKNAGISIIGEKNLTIDACFLDSEHTLNNLMNELDLAAKLFSPEAIVMIDDGYYNYKYENTAFENMIRSKLLLPPVDYPKDNISQKCFWEYVEEYLKENFNNVDHIEDNYKNNFSNDLYFKYYQNDLSVMNNLEMSYSPEQKEQFEHRFDAWRVHRV